MHANQTWQFLAVLSMVCLFFTASASAQTDVERPDATIHDRDILIPGINAISTTIGAFTGGDPGEGLDLRGNFLHAVNFDEAVSDQRVGNANFVHVEASALRRRSASGPIPGTLLAGHGGPPEYGDSANDNALEAVMNSSHIAASNQRAAAYSFSTPLADQGCQDAPRVRILRIILGLVNNCRSPRSLPCLPGMATYRRWGRLL